MSTTWFTSDLHIGHRFVSGIREFKDAAGEPDVHAHNSAIIAGWKDIQSDDIVWVLGDICISEKTWAGALRLIADYMPGHKRLICGNHDPISSIHRNAWKHYKAALEVFESVQDFAKIRMLGETVLLSHYPYSGVGAEGLRKEDGTQIEERYTEFRLTDCGTPLLHGHTHGTEKLHFSQAGTPQVHIGLDAWNMKPVSTHDIEKLLVDFADAAVTVEA